LFNLKNALLILAVGNFFHFLSVLLYLFVLNAVDFSETLFITVFMTLQLIDYIANLIFLIIIISEVEDFRDEISVLSVFFILFTLFSRITVLLFYLQIIQSDLIIFPIIILDFFDILISNLNLIAISSVLFSVILYYISRTEIAETKEVSIKALALVKGSISILFLLSFYIELVNFIASLLYLLKALIAPLIMMLISLLWFKDLIKLEESNISKIAEAKGFPSISVYKQTKDLVIAGKYPNYPTYEKYNEIITNYQYPDYITFEKYHESVISGNFPNYPTFSKANNKGINDYTDFQKYYDQIVEGNFPSQRIYNDIGKYGNYDLYKKSVRMGLNNPHDLVVYDAILKISNSNVAIIEFENLEEETKIKSQDLMAIIVRLLRTNLVDGRIDTNTSDISKTKLVITNINQVKIESVSLNIKSFLKILSGLPLNQKISINELGKALRIPSGVLEIWLIEEIDSDNLLQKQFRYDIANQTISRITRDVELSSGSIANLLRLLNDETKESQHLTHITDINEFNEFIEDEVWQKQEELQEKLIYAETLNNFTEMLMSKEKESLPLILNELSTLLNISNIVIYKKRKNDYKKITEFSILEEYIDIHHELLENELLNLKETVEKILISFENDVNQIIQEFQLGDIIHNRAGVQTFILHKVDTIFVEIDSYSIIDLNPSVINFLEKLCTILASSFK
jgi:hypothetical protein